MIRTLQDRAVALGIQVYMECTITRLITGPAGVTGAFGYWRTTGQPIVFPAKAIVLATGGIGKAYEVTSNSWEYSGDGQALAYEAGAELIDMEFVQFHPTGMVWPPGVRGLLVTEAVRGEGGILRNKDGERFMWDVPARGPAGRVRRHRRGGRPLGDRPVRGQGDRRAAAARAVDPRQRRAGDLHRGQRGPRLARTAASSSTSATCRPRHVRRKLPSMYEQFKELADVDITTGPMEVGPTTHYVMGGIRVDAETGATTRRRACTRRARSPAGCTAPTGSAATRCRTCSCSGPGPGGAAAAHAAATDGGAVRRPGHGPGGGSRRSPRRSSGPTARTRTRLQRDLQDVMQRLVGIFRVEADLDEALVELAELRAALVERPVVGRPDLQPGLEPRLRAATTC